MSEEFDDSVIVLVKPDPMIKSGDELVTVSPDYQFNSTYTAMKTYPVRVGSKVRLLNKSGDILVEGNSLQEAIVSVGSTVYMNQISPSRWQTLLYVESLALPFPQE